MVGDQKMQFGNILNVILQNIQDILKPNAKHVINCKWSNGVVNKLQVHSAHECEYIKKRYMYIVAERDGVSESLENAAYKANTQSLANFWDKDEILLKNVQQELLIIQF